MTIQTEVRPAVEPKVKSVGDVLRHAALIIEERGWCQVNFERPDGSHCMVGAINVAADRDWDLRDSAHRAAMDYTHAQFGTTPMPFNDHRDRTAAEVTAALRAAADEADRV